MPRRDKEVWLEAEDSDMKFLESILLELKAGFQLSSPLQPLIEVITASLMRLAMKIEKADLKASNAIELEFRRPSDLKGFSPPEDYYGKGTGQRTYRFGFRENTYTGERERVDYPTSDERESYRVRNEHEVVELISSNAIYDKRIKRGSTVPIEWGDFASDVAESLVQLLHNDDPSFLPPFLSTKRDEKEGPNGALSLAPPAGTLSKAALSYFRRRKLQRRRLKSHKK